MMNDNFSPYFQPSARKAETHFTIMSFRLSANSFRPFSRFSGSFPGAFRSARLASGRHEMRLGELSGSRQEPRVLRLVRMAGILGRAHFWILPGRMRIADFRAALFERQFDEPIAKPPLTFLHRRRSKISRAKENPRYSIIVLAYERHNASFHDHCPGTSLPASGGADPGAGASTLTEQLVTSHVWTQ